MIRSIRNRIYWVGLFPLASLAVALTAHNGFTRLQQLDSELEQMQGFANNLLQGPAQDALILGNVDYFSLRIREVMQRSDRVQCIELSDLEGLRVAQSGHCTTPVDPLDRFVVETSTAGLSDLVDVDAPDQVLGWLRITMNRADLDAAAQTVWLQIALSVFLVLLVALLVARVLRHRLIEPIEAIDRTLGKVSDGDLTVRVGHIRDDELGQLSAVINDTIVAIETSVRELELRRDEATRALDDADRAALAREGLVRSMAEDIEHPLDSLNEQLTELAVKNQDPTLRVAIRDLLVRLQVVQSNFLDLVEIANAERPSLTRPLPIDLNDFLEQIRAAAQDVASKEWFNLEMTVRPDSQRRIDHPMSGLMVEIDASRTIKALMNVLKNVAGSGGHKKAWMEVEFRQQDDERISARFTVGSALADTDTATQHRLIVYSDAPPQDMVWQHSDRQVSEYLFDVLRMSMTYAVVPDHTLTAIVDGTYSFRSLGSASTQTSIWRRPDQPLSLTLVTEDQTLSRWTKRSDVSNSVLEMMDVDAAIEQRRTLVEQDVVLIDFSMDIAGCVSLVDALSKLSDPPNLIAICPSGLLSEALVNRLSALGFQAILQKPVRFSQMLDIVRTTLTQSNNGEGR